MTAASFDISKAKDESGQEIEPVHEYTPGLLRQVLRVSSGKFGKLIGGAWLINSNPKPFKCSMRPRSEHAIALIRSVEEEHPFKTGDSEVLKSVWRVKISLELWSYSFMLVSY